MSASSSLLATDRHKLRGHRLRGHPAFWLGFVSTVLSLLGSLARQREIPEVRTIARHALQPLPGPWDTLAGLFHFQSGAPFVTIATGIGVVLLIWGWVELLGAARIKRELAEAEELRRRQEIARELESETVPPPAQPRHG